MTFVKSTTAALTLISLVSSAALACSGQVSASIETSEPVTLASVGAAETTTPTVGE